MMIMNCPDLKQGLDEGEAAQQLDITLYIDFGVFSGHSRVLPSLMNWTTW